MVDVFSDSTGTDQGRLDPAVSDDFCGEGSKEGLSLIGRFTQLLEPLTVRHLQGGGGGCRTTTVIPSADGPSHKGSSGGCKREKMKMN